MEQTRAVRIEWGDGGKEGRHVFVHEETEEHADGRFCAGWIALEMSENLADALSSGVMTSSSIIVETDWRMW